MNLSTSLNSRVSRENSSTELININWSDELHDMIDIHLEQLQEWNQKLRELLVDSVPRSLDEDSTSGAEMDQKKLKNAIESSTELDGDTKERILQSLETLECQSGTKTTK